MKPSRATLNTVLAGLMASSSFATYAGIDRAPGSDYHAAVLVEDSKQFTNAIVNYAVHRGGDPLSKKQTDRMRRTASAATVARLEYTWEASDAHPAGRLTIHGRSGQPLETLAATAGTTSGSESGSTFQWTPDQITREADEAGFYPRMEGHIRATIQRNDSSRLVATIDNKAGDAELKALQTLEREIQANRVPAGGILKGTVSKAICASCVENLNRFSAAYGVDGKVFYLVNEDEANALRGATAMEDKLQLIDDSVRSNRAVFARRQQYIAEVMGGPATEWRTVGDAAWIERRSLAGLAAAEAGSLTARECP